MHQLTATDNVTAITVLQLGKYNKI